MRVSKVICHGFIWPWDINYPRRVNFFETLFIFQMLTQKMEVFFWVPWAQARFFLTSQSSSRALMGLGPKANRLRNARSILCPNTPKGLGPKASRSRNARSILRSGARTPLIPDAFLPKCFLSRSATPSNETANRLFMI